MHSGPCRVRGLCVLVFVVALLGNAQADIVDENGDPNPTFPAFYAWFNASNGVNGIATPPNGASVVSWSDRTGNGHDLLNTSGNSSERAIFRIDAVNGHPGVVFGGNDYIWSGNQGFGTVSDDKTIFVVVQVSEADGGYVFDGSSVNGRNSLLTGQVANPEQWHVHSGYSPITVGPAVQLGDVQIHSIVLRNYDIEHFLNGYGVAGGVSEVAPLQGLILGARFSVDYFFSGVIAEILVYDSGLNDPDRIAIEDYLLKKYLRSVNVFRSGDGLYYKYRIPSIITTMDGTLLAFAEGRAMNNDNPDQAENDIVMRRSLDGGDTWQQLNVLCNMGADSLNDPLIVQVRTGVNSGRIYLHFMRFPECCDIHEVEPGYDGPNISRNYLMYSDDDGISWSAPVEVTERFKRETAHFAGSPGIGLQKIREPHIGRVVMPIRQGWPQKLYAVFSDDGGDNWYRGGIVDDSQTPGGGDEVQFVELVDGTIMLNARSRSGTNHRKIAFSYNGGLSWTPLMDDDELIEPGVMASVIRYTEPIDGFEQSRILYSGPNSTQYREKGTVRLSYDEGDTWPIAREIYRYKFDYSVLTIIDPCSSIGCLFERDYASFISLARFSLDWLSSGSDLAENEPPCQGIVGVDDRESMPPDFYTLQQNFPNPFNPQTVISYDLPSDTDVTLAVYDLSGRLVRTLKSAAFESQGRHEVTWDGRDDTGRIVSSGVYLSRLKSNGQVAHRKMVLLR